MSAPSSSASGASVPGLERSATRPRRAVVAALAVSAILLTTALWARTAAAALACDAGAVCPDEDNDGFAKCGCAWSGTPCDCDDTDPNVYPGAPERCDATKDSNCNGVAPDRCPTAQGCLDSTCVPACIQLNDFGCAIGSTFAHPPDSGACLCKPNDCSVFGCPAGETCDDSKTCAPTCTPDVRCPYGQICRGFGCVDPCDGVTCPEGSVCAAGRCSLSCACQPGGSCPPGQSCDLTAPVPSCVDAACSGVSCPSGQHCEHGGCVDDCAGVVCPVKTVCRKVSVNGDPPQGKCVDLCNPSPCQLGYACQWRTGDCVAIPVPEGGLAAPPDLAEVLEVGGAGWACSATVARASTAAVVASAVALSIFAARRRRRRRG